MSNPTKIKKKSYDYELATEQSYYKNLFSFLNGVQYRNYKYNNLYKKKKSTQLSVL